MLSEGSSISAIAKECKVAKGTVIRWIKMNTNG